MWRALGWAKECRARAVSYWLVGVMVTGGVLGGILAAIR